LGAKPILRFFVFRISLARARDMQLERPKAAVSCIFIALSRNGTRQTNGVYSRDTRILEIFNWNGHFDACRFGIGFARPSSVQSRTF
jgi:hypothetical protein